MLYILGSGCIGKTDREKDIDAGNVGYIKLFHLVIRESGTVVEKEVTCGFFFIYHLTIVS